MEIGKMVLAVLCGTMKAVPKVTFLPENVTVEFESGKLPYSDHGKPESLLDIALHCGIHLEHACGGSCACTTCHVIVRKGDANLSEAEEEELDRVEQAAALTIHSRLGCHFRLYRNWPVTGVMPIGNVSGRIRPVIIISAGISRIGRGHRLGMHHRTIVCAGGCYEKQGPYE